MGEGFARTKRLPPLEKVLKNLEPEKARSIKPMTAAAAQGMARTLHAMFGGPDKAKDEETPNPAKKPPRPRRPRRPKKPKGE